MLGVNLTRLPLVICKVCSLSLSYCRAAHSRIVQLIKRILLHGILIQLFHPNEDYNKNGMANNVTNGITVTLSVGTIRNQTDLFSS